MFARPYLQEDESMMKYVLGACCLCGLLVGTAMAGNMEKLIADRCLGCHDMAKVCMVESDDIAWWKESVRRMVDYRKNLLTAEEVDEMGAFLADEANRKAVCSR